MVKHIRQEFGDCFTVCVAGKDKMIVFLTNMQCIHVAPENFNTSPTEEILLVRLTSTHSGNSD